MSALLGPRCHRRGAPPDDVNRLAGFPQLHARGAHVRLRPWRTRDGCLTCGRVNVDVGRGRLEKQAGRGAKKSPPETQWIPGVRYLGAGLFVHFLVCGVGANEGEWPKPPW
jgi:hypothetical protein